MALMASVINGALVTADNHKIAYAQYQAGHVKVIVVAHGFFTSKDAGLLTTFKENLIDAYDVIMFDFRGHGKSSGLFSWTTKEGLDLEAVLNYARRQQYRKIGLVGFSLGAAISIHVLAKGDAADSFVSVSSPSEFAKIDYHFWDLDLENDILYNLGEGRRGKGVRPGPFWLKKPRPIDLVGKIKCPILYVHGDQDWVISCEHSQRLYAKTQSEKKLAIIKDGIHAEYLLRKSAPELVALVKDWFSQTIKTEAER
jgi:pimeloyl-ACP methyl ester carboxylesterase